MANSPLRPVVPPSVSVRPRFLRRLRAACVSVGRVTVARITGALLSAAVLAPIAAATDVAGGTISGNVTWTTAGSPYVIKGNVNVQSGGSLTIDPGVDVRFDGNYYLSIGSTSSSAGTLSAVGTSGSPITFQFNGTPGTGKWQFVRFQNAATSSCAMAHCIVKHAGSGTAAIYVSSSSPSISNVTITDTGSDAIYLASASPVLGGTLALTGGGSRLVYATTANSEPTFASGVTLSSPNTVIGVGGAQMWSNFFGASPAFTGGPYRIQVYADTVDASATWGGVTNLASIDLLGDLTISGTSDPVLTLAAGTVVRLPAAGNIYVGGTTASINGDLIAAGTAPSPVRLERSGASAWRYINFRAGSTTTSALTHCQVVGGGSTTAAVYCTSASPSLANLAVTDSGADAIALLSSSPSFSGAISLTGTGDRLIYATTAGPEPTFSAVTLSSPNTVIGVGGAQMWSNFFGSSPVLTGGPYRIQVEDDTISWNTTWGGVANLASIDLLGDLTVAHSSAPVLTIAPGTTLRLFAATLEIGLSTSPGGLDARGTSGSPIVFTSSNASPAADQWNGISIAGVAVTSYLEHCTVEYGGGTTLDANVRIANDRTYVRHCTLRNSSAGGLVIASGAPVIEHNRFEDNVYGIDALTGALPATVVRNNVFDGNSSHGVRSASTSGLLASLNAWGHASGPAGSGPGSGDAVSTNVLFEPWLESAPSAGFEWVHASQTPDPFSQAGGETGFFASWTDDADWVLEIRDGSSALVRSFSGTAGSIDQAWIGDDSSGGGGVGAPLSNGTYTYTLAAEDASTSAAAPTARGTVTLSNTLPIARITSPNPFEFVSGTVSVQGTATGTGFTSYTLAYRVGASPTSGTWTTIATSTTPVTAGTLGSWNTSSLSQPYYSLRLTVQTSAGSAQDLVIVRKLVITSLASALDLFSPNGDAIKDATTLSGALTWPADWELSLTPDGGGAAVRTFTGSGDGFALSWDGKDELAAVVSDGGYDAVLNATEIGGGVSDEDTVLVNVDVTAPTALITAPTPSGSVLTSQTYQATGTANDTNFKSFTFSIGAGTSPSSFTQLRSSTSPVAGGLGADSLYLFSSEQFPPGTYTLRLRVEDDAGNVTTLDRTFAFDYILITAVGNTPKVIDPAASETTTVSFTVSHDCDVSVEFFQWPSDEPVATVTAEDLLAGPNSIVWDGLNGMAVFATPDVLHYYVINATDSLGRDGHFNEVGDPMIGSGANWSSWGSTSIVTTGFNPWANDEVRIEYEAETWLNAQVTVKGTNLNVPIRSMGAFPPGAHVDFWDGRNENGEIHVGSFQFFFTDPENAPDPAVFLTRGPIRFDAFRAQAYLIHPVYGQSSGFQYELTRDANVTIAIEDPNGNHVRTIISSEFQEEGTYGLDEELHWDGCDDSGLVVATQGTYSVVLSALDIVTNKTYVRRGAITVYR